jgi:hypothetical protein
MCPDECPDELLVWISTVDPEFYRTAQIVEIEQRKYCTVYWIFDFHFNFGSGRLLMKDQSERELRQWPSMSFC